MKILFDHIKVVSLLVCFAYFYAILSLQLKNKAHRYLILILSVSFFTEVLALSLTVVYQKFGLTLLYSASFIFHNALWILLITNTIENKKLGYLFLMVFVVFGIIDLTCIEGGDQLNANTFILGSLCYIVLFIYESFFQLKKENLAFFTSNHYWLLFAPVIFFFGFSFMFAFKDINLLYIPVFDITLYNAICFFVNIIYYLLIVIFIFKERKSD